MTKKTKKPGVPTIYVRCPREMKDALEQAAATERRTEKEVVLAALAAYLGATVAR